MNSNQQFRTIEGHRRALAEFNSRSDSGKYDIDGRAVCHIDDPNGDDESPSHWSERFRPLRMSVQRRRKKEKEESN